ncbi:putative bifunctional diguanylate cyclase/phosphodiesterase [Paenibacillus alkalitolerans]|uniref:putative bifunctional diguanylate cyclase/phosphodiesterase n=1 Tax=Paenibacillus alkalitolerans TaxID=2799335 RepID=UPI0018F6987E|nr:EAL domain-containing protein [Paenibacillus alkalitolerans]
MTTQIPIKKYKAFTSLLYIMLGAAAFVCDIRPLGLGLGMQSHFAGLFFLITLRIYGWRPAVLQVLLVQAAAVSARPETLIMNAIILLEILSVTALFRSFGSRRLLLPDLLFWVLLGFPIIFLIYYLHNGAIDPGLWIFAILLLINCLFNAMIADACAAYLSIFRKRPLDGARKTKVIRLSQVLRQLMLFGMIGSSFLFMLNTGESVERNVLNEMANQSAELSEALRRSYQSLSPEQVRALELRSALQLGHFRQAVEATSLTLADHAVLYGKQGDLIKQFDFNGRKIEFPDVTEGNGTVLSPSLQYVHHRTSAVDIPGMKWKSTWFIEQVNLEPFTLYLKLATDRYEREIALYYLSQSVNVLYTVSIIGIFTFFLHRSVLLSIAKLAAMTTDVPAKIREGRRIDWLHSNIAEIQTLIHNFRSVTEKLSRMLQESRQLAYYDTLTGLPNRRHFNEYLDDVMNRSEAGPDITAVMFIDLDRFKQINDTLGHGIGDRLLRQAAAKLSDIVGERAFIARLGGDEFVIVVSGTNAGEAGRLAEDVLQGLNEAFLVDGHELFAAASIGIALAPKDGSTAEEAVKNADAAMYVAKQEGGNAYRYHCEQQSGTLSEAMAIEFELRKAVERGGLALFYQPIVDTRSNTIIGAEALLRWDHPTLGWVPPLKFIPIAERCGLIGSIGEWVIREACRQNKRWLDAGLGPLRVAVNLSPTQLSHHKVAEYVEEVLEETGLPADSLDLEITEEVFVKNADIIIEELNRLRGQGVRVWIDDFGTGYSSLSMLKKLPVNGFKIDRSFVRGIAEDTDHLAIVQTVVALAHIRGWSVIGEGVEGQAEMDILASLQCDYQQGYFHGKPMPGDQFTELLQRETVKILSFGGERP